jgi:hypothetical protein
MGAAPAGGIAGMSAAMRLRAPGACSFTLPLPIYTALPCIGLFLFRLKTQACRMIGEFEALNAERKPRRRNWRRGAFCKKAGAQSAEAFEKKGKRLQWQAEKGPARVGKSRPADGGEPVKQSACFKRRSRSAFAQITGICHAALACLQPAQAGLRHIKAAQSRLFLIILIF